MSDLLNKFQEIGKRKAESSANFVSPEVQAGIHQMSSTQLNEMDFGVVKLDDAGKILFYNKYESELANIAPADAEGKNFFHDIAPCTNNRLFMGTFQGGVSAGSLKTLFHYTFTYRMKPTNVRVFMYREASQGVNWVFIKKNAI